MESDTLNDPNNKLNKYVTESFKGFIRYQRSIMTNVKNRYILKILI